ncbi:MAG: Fic family protein [Kiritimatiellaeota bacterium]|nr:Fic family protein [Kiritimatiellota bacterium]
MKKKKQDPSYDIPPFTLSARAVSMAVDIAALVERFSIRMEQRDALRLRKINKIKSIRSSLAIEGNTLSERQVTAILEGRRVVASLREIQEAKNAIATYDLYPSLNPFSVQALLKAHKVMMTALIGDAGGFRRGGVGVTDGASVIHIAPPASRVPSLMQNLFHWLEAAEDHLLIRSCVFHYEFEFIHPFSDGNGRVGRLWQSLILGKFHSVFQHLPVEAMVLDNQRAYYSALNQSTQNADCGVFIDFMLGEILRALRVHAMLPIRRHGGISGGINGGINDVLSYICKHPGCRANEISEALSIPLRSVQRHLGALKKKAAIEYRGAKKNGGYCALPPPDAS